MGRDMGPPFQMAENLSIPADPAAQLLESSLTNIVERPYKTVYVRLFIQQFL